MNTKAWFPKQEPQMLAPNVAAHPRQKQWYFVQSMKQRTNALNMQAHRCSSTSKPSMSAAKDSSLKQRKVASL